MAFIKKHLVIILAGFFIIISGGLMLIPFTLKTVVTSSLCYAVPDDLTERITSHETGVTYELNDLKTIDSLVYPKQTPLIPMNYAAGGSLVVPQTSLYLIHEGNLTRGSQLNLEFEVTQAEGGVYRYFLVNETGVIDCFETTDSTPYHKNLKIKKAGNYALILYVEEAKGDYKLNYHITRSIFPF